MADSDPIKKVLDANRKALTFLDFFYMNENTVGVISDSAQTAALLSSLGAAQSMDDPDIFVIGSRNAHFYAAAREMADRQLDEARTLALDMPWIRSTTYNGTPAYFIYAADFSPLQRYQLQKLAVVGIGYERNRDYFFVTENAKASTLPDTSAAARPLFPELDAAMKKRDEYLTRLAKEFLQKFRPKYSGTMMQAGKYEGPVHKSQRSGVVMTPDAPVYEPGNSEPMYDSPLYTLEPRTGAPLTESDRELITKAAMFGLIRCESRTEGVRKYSLTHRLKVMARLDAPIDRKKTLN